MADHLRPVETEPEPRSPLTPQQALDTLTVVPLVAGQPSACTLLGCSPKQARRRVKAGEIPVIKYGSRLMVPTAWLRSVLSIDGSDAA